MLGRELNLSGLIVIVQVTRENVPESAPALSMTYLASYEFIAFSIALTLVMRCVAKSSSGLFLFAPARQNLSASSANSLTFLVTPSPVARARTRRDWNARARARLPTALCRANRLSRAGAGAAGAAGSAGSWASRAPSIRRSTTSSNQPPQRHGSEPARAHTGHPSGRRSLSWRAVDDTRV